MNINPQNHICNIYESSAEAKAALRDHIVEGISRNEKCVCISNDPAGVIALLESVGTGAETVARFVTALQPENRFIKEGVFNGDAFFNFIIGEAKGGNVDGFSGLRMATDMTCLFPDLSDSAGIIEYELGVSRMLKDNPHISMLCQHDAGLLAKDGLRDVVTMHRLMLQNGRLIHNPYYGSSEDIALKEATDMDVERMLAAIEAVSGIGALAPEQTPESVRRSIEEMKDLYDNVPCGYHSIDKDGFIVRINNTELNWLGYSREELVGRKKITDLMTPESREAYKKNFPLFMERGQIKDVEVDYIRKDGSLLNALISAMAVKDGNGHYMMSRTIVYDVTNRKKTEEAFRKTSDLLLSILENTSNIVVVKDLEGRYLLVNSAYAKMFGRTKDDCAGKSIRDVLSKEEADFILAEDRRAVEAKGPIESEVMVRLSDGAHTHLAVRFPLFDSKGTAYAVGSIATDITERKRLEREAAESNALMRGLLDNTSSLIIIKDLEGRYLLVNRAHEKVFGRTNEELRNKSAYDILTKDVADLLLAEDRRAVEAGGPIHMETEIPQPDGPHTHLIVKFPLSDLNGVPYAVGSISTDITERKRMEAELAKIQRLESIGLLAGGIAHDFNNILSSILLNVTGAALAVKEGSPEAQKLAEAEKAVLRAKGLTRQLLTFSKGGSPVRKTMSMSAFLLDAAALPMSGSNSRLELNLGDNLWNVVVDESQIQQVINNIVINACQAMPGGGLITITCENHVSSGRSDALLAAGRYLKIVIRDNGPGIPDDLQPRIFDPFFTTKTGGNGLGLSIAYSIVKKHGGHVSVSSRPGSGTEFSIYLPAITDGVVAADAAKAAPQKDASQSLTARRGRILIMDDDAQLRTILGELLEVNGFEVALADDGLGAISHYSDAMLKGAPYDAVVLDLTVPGGMGGRQTLEKLLLIDPNVIAIASSGYVEDDTLSKYLDYGFKACISKPFSVMEFKDVFSRLKQVRT